MCGFIIEICVCKKIMIVFNHIGTVQLIVIENDIFQCLYIIGINNFFWYLTKIHRSDYVAKMAMVMPSRRYEPYDLCSIQQ